MRDFSGGNRFGGGRRDRGNDRGGDRGRSRGGFGGGSSYGEERQMFSAVCDNCGKDCQVPFRPSGEKPVYCSDCFEKMGNGGRPERSFDSYGDDRRSSRPAQQSSGGNNDQQFKDMVTLLDKKLDKVIDLLALISEKKTLRVPSKKKEVVVEDIIDPVIGE